MRVFVLALVLGALSACGPTPAELSSNFHSRANALVGLTEQEIISRIGPPLKSYKLDGANTSDSTHYSTWAQSGAITNPGYGYTQCFRGYCFTNVQPATYTVLGCELTYKIVNGVATEYQARGNACWSN